MRSKRITIADLDELRTAQTLHAAWTKVNNDRFFDFQVAYTAVTGAQADPYDKDPANSVNIARVLDYLVIAVDILNTILVLDEKSDEADQRRCEALLTILQKEADNWTPLQSLLILLCREGVAHFTRLTEVPDHKRLVLMP
jgi:hypothetical protein